MIVAKFRRCWILLLAVSTLSIGSQAVAEKPKPSLPRVLIIGDSISIGYTKPTQQLLHGKVDVQRIPSNAGHTGMGLARLSKWLDPKHGQWDVIHFNWGLWDLCYRNPAAKNPGHRDKVDGKLTHTPEQYGKNLEKIVAQLEATGATLVWASTTPVPEGEAGRKVGDDKIYNAVAAKIMKAHGIPINDLNALMKPHMKTMTVAPGNVHFTAKGSKLLAKQVAAGIEKALASGSAKKKNSK